ncbi:hypothetical protein SAMN02799631_03244 [Methylobacterium sp. 174MFSha1.1]|uniref:hypothetical protein n=1 Tax=Methylobacterium sp. 174MFSha1.1 TaxID=1502749 RepID=UPI0008E9B5D6|nr:hypothetical protein [Methylobacterium sp. 174MFSha1.1]SFU93463.1 hypothetical protein SAMN02799631_03244 [Methylobacterium sp. 174MFSha1.1]
MRAVAILATLSAGPALASGSTWPAAGVYCPSGTDVPAIVVEGRGIGIDLLDCPLARLSGGRLRADRCYANGGSEVPYDTDLTVMPDGTLLHEGVQFRRRDRGPCS